MNENWDEMIKEHTTKEDEYSVKIELLLNKLFDLFSQVKTNALSGTVVSEKYPIIKYKIWKE